MSDTPARFKLDDFQEAPPQVPLAPLVSRHAPAAPPVTSGPVAVPAAPQEAAEPQGGQVSKTMQHLAARYQDTPQKRQTTVRLEPWLDAALEKHINICRLQGARKLTREAVIVEGLIKVLGVTPPKD